MLLSATLAFDPPGMIRTSMAFMAASVLSSVVAVTSAFITNPKIKKSKFPVIAHISAGTTLSASFRTFQVTDL